MAQVTPMTPVAMALGANRVIRGQGIVYPTGDSELPPAEERDLRRRIVQEALDALATEGRTGV